MRDARQTLVAELDRVVRQLGNGEVRLLTVLAGRLRFGQIRYGAIEADDADRTPTEEAADVLVLEAVASLANALARCGQ